MGATILVNTGTKPVVIPYGGRPYLVPPVEGGTWTMEQIQKDVRAKKDGTQMTVTDGWKFKKLSDEPKGVNTVELPDHARAHLAKAKWASKLNKAGVKILDDDRKRYDAELFAVRSDIQDAARAKLELQREIEELKRLREAAIEEAGAAHAAATDAKAQAALEKKRAKKKDKDADKDEAGEPEPN